jgi:hypothetical protein
MTYHSWQLGCARYPGNPLENADHTRERPDPE